MKLFLSFACAVGLLFSPTYGAQQASSSSVKCVGCERDSNGRIKRSESAKRTFQRANPCPSTGKTSGGCRGYEIDHTRPLYQGGADAPDNMQWLSKSQHKAKHSKLAPASATASTAKASSANSSKEVLTGPRGGKYTISKSGKKVYQRRK